MASRSQCANYLLHWQMLAYITDIGAYGLYYIIYYLFKISILYKKLIYIYIYILFNIFICLFINIYNRYI